MHFLKPHSCLWLAHNCSYTTVHNLYHYISVKAMYYAQVCSHLPQLPLCHLHGCCALVWTPGVDWEQPLCSDWQISSLDSSRIQLLSHAPGQRNNQLNITNMYKYINRLEYLYLQQLCKKTQKVLVNNVYKQCFALYFSLQVKSSNLIKNSFQQRRAKDTDHNSQIQGIIVDLNKHTFYAYSRDSKCST